MIIDSVQVKKFWDAQAKKADQLKLEGIASLEEDAQLLEMKVSLEQTKIMSMINLAPASSYVLDLGAGTGQWALRFANLASHVVAVEYSSGMLAHAIEAARVANVENISFEHCRAQDYDTKQLFDLIWISGLLIYLEDDECDTLIKNCSAMMVKGGQLILRDGTGTKRRHEIRNQYSEALNTSYSATYRTAEVYLSLFERHGFRVVEHSDMFPEGSQLNKWDETRLRVYQFSKS